MTTLFIYTRSIIYATMPPPTVQKRQSARVCVAANTGSIGTNYPLHRDAGEGCYTQRCCSNRRGFEQQQSNQHEHYKPFGLLFSSHYYCSSSSFGHATPMEGVEFTGALKLAPVQAAEAAVTTDSTPTEARSANSASRAIQRGEKPRRIATPRPRRRTNVHGGKMA
ncbi:hypothetical protein BDF19DRAFT_465220 [Syncephalis fuscata]|nr:hypothetical protein BDF19DRAFT_465220 [Syncephalis fuscata]